MKNLPYVIVLSSLIATRCDTFIRYKGCRRQRCLALFRLEDGAIGGTRRFFRHGKDDGSRMKLTIMKSGVYGLWLLFLAHLFSKTLVFAATLFRIKAGMFSTVIVGQVFLCRRYNSPLTQASAVLVHTS